MNKKNFIIRLSLYAIFGGIVPFLFLMFRFDLFKSVSKISLTGWGLVAVIVAAIFFIKLFKSVKKGLPFSIATQIIEGVCKETIPLIATAICVYFVADLTTQVFQFLCVLALSETIAFSVNPIPEWANKNKLTEEQTTIKALIESLRGDKEDK